jgi:hypothetical protein
MNRQTEFRTDIRGRLISTRPDAIHALRQYLRICMPFTIETEINTTITAFERGGAGALEDRDKLVSSATVGTQVIRVPTAPIAPPRRAPVVVDQVRVGAFEQRLSASEIRDFQKVVCVASDGRFTPATRAALLAFLTAKNLKDQSFPDRITAKDGTRLSDALDAGPRC